MRGCFWYYDTGGSAYCCWGINPAGLDSEELWAGPESYSNGPCTSGGDASSRDCLCSDKMQEKGKERDAYYCVWDREHEKGILEEFKGSDAEPSLPGRIKKIGSWVFSDNHAITSVYLPKGLIEIGENAFNGCKNLRAVTIPPKVEVIGEFAFHMCTSLSSVNFSIEDEQFQIIGRNAFCHCIALKNVVFPRGPKTFDEGAFYGCHSLETVVIGEGTVSIGANVFADCHSLKTIDIPSSATFIDDKAFSPGDKSSQSELVIIGSQHSAAKEYAMRKGIAFHLANY